MAIQYINVSHYFAFINCNAQSGTLYGWKTCFNTEKNSYSRRERNMTAIVILLMENAIVSTNKVNVWRGEKFQWRAISAHKPDACLYIFLYYFLFLARGLGSATIRSIAFCSRFSSPSTVSLLIVLRFCWEKFQEVLTGNNISPHHRAM